MKYHYIPKTNESQFNHIAKEATPILVRRHKATMASKVVKRRNAVLRELSDLRYKPYKGIEDEKRMAELEAEAKQLMRQIGDIARQ